MKLEELRVALQRGLLVKMEQVSDLERLHEGRLRSFLGMGEDLADFLIEVSGDRVQLIGKDDSKGYDLFDGKNYEIRMIASKELTEGEEGKEIIRYFVNNDLRMAGFSWRRP